MHSFLLDSFPKTDTDRKMLASFKKYLHMLLFQMPLTLLFYLIQWTNFNVIRLLVFLQLTNELKSLTKEKLFKIK